MQHPPSSVLITHCYNTFQGSRVAHNMIARRYATRHQEVDLQLTPCPLQLVPAQLASAHVAPPMPHDQHIRPWAQRGPRDEHANSQHVFIQPVLCPVVACRHQLSRSPNSRNMATNLYSRHLQQARPIPWQQLNHVLSTDKERSGFAKQAPRGRGLPTPPAHECTCHGP